MLTVTQAAAAHLAHLLAEADPEGQGFVVRLVYGPNGFGLKLDQTGPDDATFDHEGVTVLALEEELSQALAGKTLDVETTEQGQNLTIR